VEGIQVGMLVRGEDSVHKTQSESKMGYMGVFLVCQMFLTGVLY
jgi:hypothetical protein